MSLCWCKEDICSTTECPQSGHIWLLSCYQLNWCMPVKACHRSHVVEVNSVLDGKFPPGVRQASIMTHCFRLLHYSSIKSLCTTVLLGSMQCGLEDFNSCFLQQLTEGPTLVFSSSITHPFTNRSIVLSPNHSKEMTECSNGGSLVAHQRYPSIRQVVINE